MTVNLGTRARSDRGHHLRAITRNATGLRFLAHHESGDVLQEYEWNVLARAQFDEVRRLQRALGKENAVVGDDAHGIAADMREARDERDP